MASSVASASSTIFESLPARPPTPPREAAHDTEASLKAQFVRPGAFDASLSLQTPPNAASAVCASQNGSSRTRKKVEWSSHTEYKEASEFRQSKAPNKSSPSSAPSSALKPVKGILKPSSSPVTLTTPLGGDAQSSPTHKNIIDMLDSTIKQLAGSDRHSKLDAYMMLARALKASNNLPDRVALQDKMSLFMQFIQRDVTAKTENATLDTSLINHALSLLATFLHFSAVASTLTSDFGIFIIDHAIRSFEEPAIPKDIVRHLMQVVALQNFSAKVMTSDRVGRLIAALHKIDEHLKGKSIIMTRIVIYRRLVKQSRNQMITNSDWIQDLFSDMLSNVREIRLQAIELGTEAGFSFRSEKQLMLKAADILQAVNENETYIAFYIRKLQDMLKDKQTASAVPQIWGVLVLFCRCPLERWQYYGPWLTIVQSAFNMADFTTKHEANYAWNRYVYLSLSDNKTTPKSLGVLCQPLLSQLRRKMSPKHVEESLKLRRTVMGSICNLWYYAFAPGSDKYPTSIMWEVTVQPIISSLINLHGKPDIPADCLMQAARFLTSLLDISTPRVWRHDRILDLPPVKIEELPSIDAKWTRRNCDKVLELVEPILEEKFLDLANKESLTSRLWTSLVGSITSASAKDIKVSDETIKFLAAALGMLSKIWSAGTTQGDGVTPAKLFASVRNYVDIMVSGLGVLPFTEKKVSLSDFHTDKPAATTSKGPEHENKPQGVASLPLHHLFSTLVAVPAAANDDEQFCEFFQSVFEPFFKDKSPRSRVDLSKELLQTLPKNSLSSYGPWAMCANNLFRFLEQGSDKPGLSAAGQSSILGPEYRDLVSILERGLMSHPNLPMKHWLLLFQAAANHARIQVGDGGQALAIVEPLAKIVLELLPRDLEASSTLSLRNSMVATAALLETAKLPRDGQALEAARRRLWGNPITTARNGFVDPFESLYKLSNSLASSMYSSLSGSTELEYGNEFIHGVATFLERSFPLARLTTLTKFQSSLCMLIEDEDDHLYKDDVILSKAVCELWDQVCIELRNIGRCTKEDFDLVEPFFAAAFKCKQHYIASKAAETWNAIVQDEDDVDCSDGLKSIVSSMQSKFELLLPGNSVQRSGAQALSFRDGDEPSPMVLSSVSSAPDTKDKSSKQSSLSRTGSRSSGRKRKSEAPVERTTRQSKRRSLPRKLRHDNSQIQFERIESLPVEDKESQHLTERQKEVRERQRANKGFYSDINPSSASQSPNKRTKSATHATDGHQHAEQSTPQRNASFNDLISSTPTPRRGQLMQMDDPNDPPSSPPNPRPDPLHSEIQSRSRGASSLEWQFSSPPVSPNARQQVGEEAPPSAPDSGLAVRAPRRRKRMTRSSSQLALSISDDPEVIPSSVDIQVGEQIEEFESHSGAVKDQSAPSTPVKKQTRHAEKAEDVAAPSDKTNPPLRRTRSNLSVGVPEPAQEEVLELPTNPLQQTSRQRRTSRRQREHLPTLGQSSSPPNFPASELQRRPAAPASSPVIPSTPVEAHDSSSGQESRRKRKRRDTKQSARNRKRRSLGPKTLSDAAKNQPVNSQVEDEDILPALPNSAGVQLEAAPKLDEMRTRSGRKVGVETPKVHEKDDADTDEELMSQLVTESNAASQVELENNNSELKAAKEEQNEENDLAAFEEAQPTIFETLQKGLGQLRRATLSRDEVYKMEDMLMDMKRELFEAERRGRSST